MKHILTAITIALTLALTSCALNLDTAKGLTTVGVANYIQYGVSHSQQDDVAAQIVAVSKLNVSDTTPAGIKLQLETYLPNSPTKELTITEVVALYTLYYPYFSTKLPETQLQWAQGLLQAAGAGASPFVTP